MREGFFLGEIDISLHEKRRLVGNDVRRVTSFIGEGRAGIVFCSNTTNFCLVPGLLWPCVFHDPEKLAPLE